MDIKKIGMFLKELRIEKNLTQEQLADAIGSTNKTVSRWETGAYLPPVEMLLILSDFYKVSINEILVGHRLTDSNFKKAAEENLLDAIAESKYQVKYKETEETEKWLKHHFVELIVEFAIIISAFSVSAVYKIDLVGALLLLFLMILITYARIRRYVNKVIYGGKTNAKNKI